MLTELSCGIQAFIRQRLRLWNRSVSDLHLEPLLLLTQYDHYVAWLLLEPTRRGKKRPTSPSDTKAKKSTSQTSET